MSKQRLTITTGMTLNENPPGGEEKPFGKELKRFVWVDAAFTTVVTIPRDKAEKCFRVEAGLRDLLQFFSLSPVATKKVKQPDGTEKVEEVPIPRDKLSFTTDGPQALLTDGQKANPPAAPTSWKIMLSDSQTYVDDQIDMLFADNQAELETITFFNHTGYDVAVTIIQGRDLTPCDDDGATCPIPPAAS